MADPAPLSFKTRGGGGAGGVAYKDRARPPPVPTGWGKTQQIQHPCGWVGGQTEDCQTKNGKHVFLVKKKQEFAKGGGGDTLHKLGLVM